MIRRIGCRWSFFDIAGWSAIRLIPIIRRQLRPTLQNIMRDIIVADVHLTFIAEFLDRMMRHRVASGKQPILKNMIVIFLLHFGLLI